MPTAAQRQSAFDLSLAALELIFVHEDGVDLDASTELINSIRQAVDSLITNSDQLTATRLITAAIASASLSAMQEHDGDDLDTLIALEFEG